LGKHFYLGAKFQNWVNKNIWDFSSKSAYGPGEGYNYDLKGTDARAHVFGYQDDFSKEVITEKRALGLSTVYTCVNVIGQTLAALNINVLQEDEQNNKESLHEHPAYYPIAHQPNSYMSSANMFLSTGINLMGWGNAYIGINRNGRGEVRTLDKLCPWDVDDIQIEDGNAFYKVRGEWFHSRDILHFRLFSYDGLCGISPIMQNKITMGKAFKNERFSSYSLGKRPPGFLSYEGNLTPTQRAENQETWEKDIAVGRTPHLSGRHHYNSTMVSPSDAQYIETEGITDRKIYGIFRIPPVFAQDYIRATWTNAEQSDLLFAKHTVMPIVRVMEQECNMKLFSEREKKNTYIKFNLNGLLRGDTQARAAFYTAMRNIGGMNGNEIREREDMNHYEGGDIFTIQSANAPIDMLRKFYESMSEPAATAQPSKSKLGVNGHGALN
jgi:HK97 family phage portal protein